MDIAELTHLYEVEKLTARQIGERVNVPFRTVLRYLHKAGVILRNPGAERCAILGNGEWLRAKYLDERLSTPQIAKLAGCTPRVVLTALVRHGIETRSPGSEKGHQRFNEEGRRKLSEAKRDRYTGADNPNWRGGQPSVDPERNRYPAKAWVKAVKDRDGWRCVECGSTDRLHAHHVKRWKHHPELRYDVSNGVTLCHLCHDKAHGRQSKYFFKHAECSTSAPPPLG